MSELAALTKELEAKYTAIGQASFDYWDDDYWEELVKIRNEIDIIQVKIDAIHLRQNHERSRTKATI